MKARCFENQVLVSSTNQQVCSFFFNRWRKNANQPLLTASIDRQSLINQYIIDLNALGEVNVPMFDVELFDQDTKFSLPRITKKREPLCESELNVLFITKPLTSNAGRNDFNQILDAMIRTFSDQ